jgi:Zn-dependent protease
MVRFILFGIPVQVQPFFWVTLVIIGGALDATSATDMLRIGLFVIAGFISILVHELGHALAARKFGAYSEITLQAFGGYAAYSGVRLTRPQSFLVTAAGPAVQMLLGYALLKSFVLLPPINQNAGYFLVTLMQISLFWALLNLLPVLPMDGGQMLNAVLGPRRVRITLWVTLIVSVVVGGLLFYSTSNPMLALFLAMFAWQAYQALRENHGR